MLALIRRTFVKRCLLALLLLWCFSPICFSQSSLKDWAKKAEGALEPSKSAAEGLSDDRITSGLKEALRVSTGRAVASTGRPDGFLTNAAIKILLPPKLQSAGKTMRMFGMGAQVDQLEVGMNRAAEQATPQAKQIFLNALTRMTFNDVHEIFTGGDTAATDYFKRQSTDELTTAFTPIVHQAMLKVGVIRQYNSAMQNPVFSRFAASEEFNLDAYVVGKTLDGLFYELGQEEKKIRKDPAAQTTELLREVFGNRQ
jgi:Protein of unknown function (DUF4197)